MPAHKRSPSENLDDDEDDEDFLLQHYLRKQSRRGREAQDEANEQRKEDEEEEQEEEEDEEEDEEQEEEEDSDDFSRNSSNLPEWIFVVLPDVRKSVQCPICLGIIKKTRTVMECMHRFCRECIDKSMRLGNNECPACRTHCASRRSLRDDPRYDALIEALYSDIAKYEEEELTFHEEEKARNKQIQESIAQISQRQSEALVKRRTLGKHVATSSSTPRAQQRIPYPRRRKKRRSSELQVSDENDDETDNNDYSSPDERRVEMNQRTGKRCARSDNGHIANDIQVAKERRGSLGNVWNTEILAWGSGGARSHTRHGSGGSNNKSARSVRLSKLVNYLNNLEENENELNVHFILVSLDKQKAPAKLQPRYHCCRSSLSVKHLCEYVVAHEEAATLRAEDVEMVMLKEEVVQNADEEQQFTPNLLSTSATDDDDDVLISSLLSHQLIADDSCKFKFGVRVLEEQETLGGIVKANCTFSRSNHLIIGYRHKESSKQNL